MTKIFVLIFSLLIATTSYAIRPLLPPHFEGESAVCYEIQKPQDSGIAYCLFDMTWENTARYSIGEGIGFAIVDLKAQQVKHCARSTWVDYKSLTVSLNFFEGTPLEVRPMDIFRHSVPGMPGNEESGLLYYGGEELPYARLPKEATLLIQSTLQELAACR